MTKPASYREIDTAPSCATCTHNETYNYEYIVCALHNFSSDSWSFQNICDDFKDEDETIKSILETRDEHI